MIPFERARAMPITLMLALLSLGASRHPDATARATSVAAQADRDTTMPECPRGGRWSGTRGAPGIHIGHLTLPGPITDVPEFHDCQRFVVDSSGKLVFDSLFAIFARFKLDSVAYDTLTGATALVRPIAVAEIYSFQRGRQFYAPLGIYPYFNCLVVYPNWNSPSKLEAKMVPVGLDEERCADTSIVRARGTVLHVKRVLPPPGLARLDIPPVARWDWDVDRKEQYIGVHCGDAWCEIGRQSPQGVALFSSSQNHTSGSTDVAVRRTFEVKGWYDEQRLAIPAANGLLGVGALTGTLVPAADLGSHKEPEQSSAFAQRWVHAAWATIDVQSSVYQQKLNLGHGLVGPGMNDIALCYGGVISCLRRDGNGLFHSLTTAIGLRCTLGSKWLARIRRRDGGQVAYYCITRRSHADELKQVNETIPGVVRWRWALHDDTMWIRCLEGCCEVDAQ